MPVFTRPALPAALLLQAGLLFGAACAPRPDAAAPRPPLQPELFQAERALRETADLAAIYPRDAGTPGAEKAARHLRDRLRHHGLEAFIDSFPDRTPTGTQTFHNVFGRLPGQGRGLILLASHYDTKAGMAPPFCGANDSASSSGVLLELARLLAPHTNLPPEILLVFFDGEECLQAYSAHDGLHGSKHLARQLVENGKSTDVLALILLDMVGDPDYNITIPQNTTPALVRIALKAAEEEGIRSEFSLYRYAIGDDHVPFLNAGMPAINLIDFEFGSDPGRNDYWHTPEDHMGRISAESLGKTGRVVLRMLNALLQ